MDRQTAWLRERETETVRHIKQSERDIIKADRLAVRERYILKRQRGHKERERVMTWERERQTERERDRHRKRKMTDSRQRETYRRERA